MAEVESPCFLLCYSHNTFERHSYSLIHRSSSPDQLSIPIHRPCFSILHVSPAPCLPKSSDYPHIPAPRWPKIAFATRKIARTIDQEFMLDPSQSHIEYDVALESSSPQLFVHIHPHTNIQHLITQGTTELVVRYSRRILSLLCTAWWVIPTLGTRTMIRTNPQWQNFGQVEKKRYSIMLNSYSTVELILRLSAIWIS